MDGGAVVGLEEMLRRPLSALARPMIVLYTAFNEGTTGPPVAKEEAMRIVRLGTALLLAFAGCSPPSLDTGAVRADLEEQTAAWDAAANSRDVEALVSLHEENGVRMNANDPAHVGADAIRASFLAAWDVALLDASSRVTHDRLEHPILHPCLKPPMNGALRAKTPRQVLPFRPIVKDPENASHDLSLISRRPTTLGATRRFGYPFHKPIQLFIREF